MALDPQANDHAVEVQRGALHVTDDRASELLLSFD